MPRDRRAAARPHLSRQRTKTREARREVRTRMAHQRAGPAARGTARRGGASAPCMCTLSTRRRWRPRWGITPSRLRSHWDASDLTLSDLATQVRIYLDAHAFGMLPSPNIPPKLHALRRKTSGLTDTTRGTSLSLSSDADLAESIKQWLSDDGRLAFGVAVTETRGGETLMVGKRQSSGGVGAGWGPLPDGQLAASRVPGGSGSLSADALAGYDGVAARGGPVDLRGLRLGE
ncbi:hypothetical protein T492DRAFT_463808 [Pavlovales sp. CCMP2436]|nr:hypothetical protein T492DRAFT_463808 [Pavlovales sp. CCMP2436]